MPRKLTHNEFIKKFHEKNSNANNIDILEYEEINKKHSICSSNYLQSGNGESGNHASSYGRNYNGLL